MASIIKVDTIQDQDGNNIISEAANTITIGASGDTITIPSGATLSTASFSSTGIDDNATSTAITIDSSEDVDIGATISSTGATSPQVTISSTGEQLLLQGTTNGIGQSVDILFEQKLTTDNTRLGGKISSVATGAYTAGSGDTYESALVFYSSDNNINTERMRIDHAGNVGIGTTSPSNTLHVDSTSSTVTKFERDSGVNGSLTIGFPASRPTLTASSDLVFQVSSERMRITSGGNVGIGNSSPTAKLDVVGNIDWGSQGNGRIFSDANWGCIITADKVSPAQAEFMFQNAGGVERMRINSSGNVGIGTTTPDAKLSVNGVASFGDGTASAPSITNIGDLNTGMFFPADNQIGFATNGAETVRINANGAMALGTNTIEDKLHVFNGNTGSNTGTGIRLGQGYNSVYSRISSNFGGSMGIYAGTGSANAELSMYVNDTIRMRIDNAGNVLVGKTSTSGSVPGSILGVSGYISASRNSAALAIFNRLIDDGDLVSLQQANIQEGTISVSGSTVSYNGFTGTHWSRFTDNSTPTILRGTVLETLDEMCDWYNLEFDVTTTTQDEDGNDVTNTSTKKVPHVLLDSQSNGDVITYNHEGTDYQATIVKENDVKHMMSKVSDNSDAKNVYGVFVAYDLDGEGYNDFYVASVGSFVVRIKQGETIAKGDLLQSNGDGTAKVQTDDAVRSSSFAKVLSTTIIETYEDGSYLVPCSLMC